MSLALSNPDIYGIISMKMENFMPKLIDLTGKVFGRLKVLSREIIPNKRPRWECLCECGNTTISTTADLRSGDKKSCGCLRKDLLRVDITGKRFGKLIVVSIGESRGKSSSEFWLCKCDCGNEHTVSSRHLRDGDVKSCGCWFLKENEVLLEEAKKRFFENIEKTESCWIWKGVDIKGYGVMFFKKCIKAHRFSYMIHKGELEKDKMICHTCDNPICVNPDHLYQGITIDNSRDMVQRNRSMKGSRHPKAKITEEDLKEIYNRKNKGVFLAKKFGLSENQICSIRNGRSWKNQKCPQEVL